MFDNMTVEKREGSPTTFAQKKVLLTECTVEYSVYFNDKTGDVDCYMDVYSFPGHSFLCSSISAQSQWREIPISKT